MNVRLVFSNQILTQDNLMGWNYDQNIGDSDWEVGIVAMAEFNFTSQIQRSIGDTFTLYFTFQEAVERSFGTFTIKNISKIRDTFTYQCFDNLVKADVDITAWFNQQTYSTLSNLFVGLCQHLNLSYSTANMGNQSFSVSRFVASNLTGLQLLSQIAKIAGQNLCCSAGSVVWVYPSGNTALSQQLYFSKHIADYTTDAVDKITIQTASSGSTEWTSVGNGTNTLMITGSFLAYSKETETSAFNTIFNRLPRYAPSEVRTYDDFGLKVGDFFVIDSVKSIVMHKMITPSGVILRSTGGKERIKPSAIFGDGITQSELDSAKVSIDTTNFGFHISAPPQETYLIADNVHNLYTGTQSQNRYGTEARLSGMEGIYWKGPNGYTMMKLGAEYGRDGNYHRGYFGYLDDNTGKVMSWTPVRAQDSWKVIESDSRSSDNTWHNLPTDIFYSSALRFYILGVYDQSDGLAATTIVPVYPPEVAPKYSKAKCTYFYNASTMRTARAEFDWANQKYKLWIEGGSDREAILIGCY